MSFAEAKAAAGILFRATGESWHATPLGYSMSKSRSMWGVHFNGVTIETAGAVLLYLHGLQDA